MVLSKALKVKLSSIPSGVTSLTMPNLDLWAVEKTTAAVGLRSTTCRGDSSCTRGPLEALLDVNVYGLRGASGALSLGRGR